MTIEIRAVTVEDVVSLLPLYPQFCSEHDSEQAVTQLKKVLAKMAVYPNYTVYMVLDEGKVTAAFSLLIMDNLAHQGAAAGLIDALYIAKEAQKKEPEKLMLDFAKKLCDKAHCYKLSLSSNQELVTKLLADDVTHAQHGRCFIMDLVNREKKDAKAFFRPLNHGLSMREASQADLPAILDLYAQPGMDDGKILSLSQAQTLYKKMCTYPNYKIFVTVAEQQVVGTFALLIVDSLAHQGKSLAVVEDVMVGPKVQGKGVGRFMMDFALKIAEEQGCYKVTLSSNLKRVLAHNFYKSLGFVEQGASFLVTPCLEPLPQASPAEKQCEMIGYNSMRG